MKQTLLGTILFTVLLQAGNIGLNLNSDDVEVEGTLDISSTIGYGSDTAYFIRGSLLRSGNDNLLKAAFGASNTLPDAPGLSFSFGIEGVFAKHYVAMPLFGEASFRLPLDAPIPATTLTAQLSYAPSVLSFVDAEQYLEYRFEADMEMLSHVHLYGGYRTIDTDYQHYDHTFNDSWYGGLRIGF